MKLAKPNDEMLLRCLDGELTQTEREVFLANLSDNERQELLATENAMQALNHLPRIEAPAALLPNVMAAIIPKQAPLLARLKGWLERHPLLGWEMGGMAAAASLLFVMLAPNMPQPSDVVPMAQGPFVQAAATDAAQGVRAKFRLYAPQAHSVALIGDFNGWGSERQLQLRSQGNGIWTVDVPLPVGRYQYAFLIDGNNMVTDPRAEQHVNDDFGRKNAVIMVM